MTPTIYHNPACGTSRNTLAMIRAAGIEPVVIEYLKTPPSPAEILAIVKATGGTLRDLIREKGTPYAELDLGNAKWSDADLLGFIAQHPILLNRPIVVTSKGTALCRPSEKVLELLPEGAVNNFTKEDGEVVRRG
jgi:arsenate reductase (glutaredoxin)